ncbi:unnamed protein product, partial [Choristocarpus tenellus]
VTSQVIQNSIIPRLVCLFANSGPPAPITVRKNAAICMARLGKIPDHKQVLTELRGMEMIVQTGTGLGV